MELFSEREKRKCPKRAKPRFSRQKPCGAVVEAQSNALAFALMLSCLIILFVLSLLSLPIPAPDTPTQRPEMKNLTLLIWWLPFGSGLPLPDCELNYGARGCTVTSDRRAYAHADAVIMHHRELIINWEELPEKPRPPAQKWIWMNFESPSHSGFLHRLDGMFNLTMSYRVGSDIFLPYGYLQRRRFHGNRQVRVERHRGLVAWVISNWSEEQERVQFYYRLQPYLHVDIYGRDFRPLLNDSVVETVSRYKFYLAFENSCHTDYITEKLWRNALVSGAVPVVLGPPRVNYERFLPADAFIHAEDFKGPRALAAYLKHLDRNPALYRRYQRWRRDYDVHVTSFWAEHFCAACQAVQASLHVNKTIRHLAFWFES
ncbi:alpha-(1,3)-fucosyltransferase 4-like [Ictalurus furcatus]|uniref:alpha-(1,3)-fucosyltransferase 4-like n=1 Tax=Ictalurus furcatus TaxID=66913 RepID=UPI002350C11D|nr:alpha-(1,3)-fucosyltransferase 4-like [Ictalurus furcatus]